MADRGEPAGPAADSRAGTAGGLLDGEGDGGAWEREDEDENENENENEDEGRATPALLIPAGMAFGTGEHATTATCLRLLVDVSRTQPAGWEMLDLGTGSGILAIAGRMLGAQRVEAGDFDPHAVRTAKENVKANGVDRVVSPQNGCARVAARAHVGSRRREPLQRPAPGGRAEVCAGRRPGGKLIFSGILREQEAEVTGAIQKAGFAIEKLVRKGKWVSGLATRRG